MFGSRKHRSPAPEAPLGTALVALRLHGDVRLPPGCVELVFSAAGQARRAPRQGAGKGEVAYAYHPGPYETVFAPFAAAPEIGLRLRYVADAADPRVAQQRFDLFLFSEAGDALPVDTLHGAVAAAVCDALAQGMLDLPACTTLEEWHGFRAGLNELLYTRFGLTVDDCVPVDLGDAIDYAALLRARVAPVADAAVLARHLPTAGATPVQAGIGAGRAGRAGGAAAEAGVGVGAGVGAGTGAQAQAQTESQAQAGAEPELAVPGKAGMAPAWGAGAGAGHVGGAKAQHAPRSPDVDAGMLAGQGAGLQAGCAPGAARHGRAGAGSDAAAGAGTSPGSGAASVSSTNAAPAVISGGPAPGPSVHRPAGTATVVASAAAPTPDAGAALPPAADTPERFAASPPAGAVPTAGGPYAAAAEAPAPSPVPADPGQADAHALRRLFLELPAWSAAVRALEIPSGQSLFSARREVLQRCAQAALDVNTMPALAWSAPNQLLAAGAQAKRAGHSVAAAQALDQAWALLARWRAAAHDAARQGAGASTVHSAARRMASPEPDAVGRQADPHAALLDEADRVTSNLAFHLAARRHLAEPSAPPDQRKEPHL